MSPSDAAGGLAALLRRQDQLLNRSQALAFMTPAAWRHRVRPGGAWQSVLPGVAAAFTGSLTQQQRWRGALLFAGPLAVLGGMSGCAAHGLRAAMGPGSVTVSGKVSVTVLVPRPGRRPRTTGFVEVRSTTRPVAPVLRAGLPLCPLPRALVDACRSLTTLTTVRALVAEAVQRRLVGLDELASELAAGERAGTSLTRRVLAEVNGGARSVPEAELRDLLRASPVLPLALWNHRLRDSGGSWLADVDAYFPEAGLVVECDSRQWHLSPQHWEDTMRRHARLEAAGLHVLHISPARRRDDPVGVVRDVERAYVSACRAGPPDGITARPA